MEKAEPMTKEEVVAFLRWFRKVQKWNDLLDLYGQLDSLVPLSQEEIDQIFAEHGVDSDAALERLLTRLTKEIDEDKNAPCQEGKDTVYEGKEEPCKN